MTLRRIAYITSAFAICPFYACTRWQGWVWGHKNRLCRYSLCRRGKMDIVIL